MLSPSQCAAIAVLIKEAPSQDAVISALKTCATVVSNAADPAKAVLKMGNAGLQKRVLGLPGGQEVLVSLGFVADASAATLTWDGSLDSDANAERAAAVNSAQARFETVAAAIAVIGDSNAPAQAEDALKLISTYVGNIVSEPNTPARRRIGASNKALNGRLLSAKGGQVIVEGCGFTAEPAQGEAEAYVCGLPIPMVLVTLATLEKAPSIWAGLAAQRTDDPDTSGDSSGGPKITADALSEAVDKIIIKSLPARSAVLARAETRDLQPALCKSEDGIHVELYTYQCASRQWTLQGSMEIPGGDFLWAANAPPHGPCLLVLVDLGDAHGTGKASEMRVPIGADGSVNEYVSARDFIEAHTAESYAQHKEPVLNMNWLEEIARKVLAAATPVVRTVENLKAAMLDQH